MVGEELQHLVDACDVYVDLQRALIDRLTAVDAVDSAVAVALHAQLDQLDAAIRQAHGVLHGRDVDA
jgi:hypothetical protein